MAFENRDIVFENEFTLYMLKKCYLFVQDFVFQFVHVCIPAFTFFAQLFYYPLHILYLNI